MVNEFKEMIDKNRTGNEVKSELWKILDSLDKICYKYQVEIEPNETFNVSYAVNVF